MSFLSSVIGGGASIVGGLLGNKGSKDAASEVNKANAEINKRNLQFAANATKIRVDDMRRAGINPLLAANPGGAAQAPQQIEAKMSDTSAGAGLASAVGHGVSSAMQTAVAKDRLLLDTVNSAEAVNKTRAEIDSLRTSQQQSEAQANLLREQTLSQETNRQLMKAQAGVHSAVEAGKKIDNAEAAARLDWIQNQGKVPWQAGIDIHSLGGGKYAQLTAGLNQLATMSTAGPDTNSAKLTPNQITKDVQEGKRESKFNFGGFRITKEKK